MSFHIYDFCYIRRLCVYKMRAYSGHVTCTGDVIRWEQQLRFRHLATRQYLCITTDRRVTLTADSKDPRTVFRLHPVIKVSTIQ